MTLDTITVLPPVRHDPQILIDTDPAGDPFTWSDGTTTYTSGAFYTARDTEITFTATVSFFDTDQSAVGYEWQFGDGAKGYANPVAHTYTSKVPTFQVIATVIDNLGQRFHARKQIYLISVGSLFPSLSLWPSDDLFPSE